MATDSKQPSRMKPLSSSPASSAQAPLVHSKLSETFELPDLDLHSGHSPVDSLLPLGAIKVRRDDSLSIEVIEEQYERSETMTVPWTESAQVKEDQILGNFVTITGPDREAASKARKEERKEIKKRKKAEFMAKHPPMVYEEDPIICCGCLYLQ